MDDIDDVIIRMIADVASRGFIARQHPGYPSMSDWLPKAALPAMETALAIEDGETRLRAILEVLDEHVDKRVVTKFLAWDGTPKMLAGPPAGPPP